MAELDRTLAVYPIGVVEKLTGLTGRQIRYYEKTGLVIPARTQGNQRLYAPIHVDRLLRVKELLAQGLNVEGVRAILRKESQNPQSSSRRPAPPAAASTAASPHEPSAAPGQAGTGDSAELGADPTLAAAGSAAASLGQVGSWETLRMGRRLGSLYPVDNQAELVRWLQQQRQGGPGDDSPATTRPAQAGDSAASLTQPPPRRQAEGGSQGGL